MNIKISNGCNAKITIIKTYLLRKKKKIAGEKSFCRFKSVNHEGIKRVLATRHIYIGASSLSSLSP